MRPCGQWLLVLGMVVTLLCPQVRAAFPAPHAQRVAHFTAAPAVALPLLCDFTLPSGDNLEDPDTAKRALAPCVIGTPGEIPLAPVERIYGRVDPVAPQVAQPAAISRPASRGPPAWV